MLIVPIVKAQAKCIILMTSGKFKMSKSFRALVSTSLFPLIFLIEKYSTCNPDIHEDDSQYALTFYIHYLYLYLSRD